MRNLYWWPRSPTTSLITKYLLIVYHFCILIWCQFWTHWLTLLLALSKLPRLIPTWILIERTYSITCLLTLGIMVTITVFGLVAKYWGILEDWCFSHLYYNRPFNSEKLSCFSANTPSQLTSLHFTVWEPILLRPYHSWRKTVVSSGFSQFHSVPRITHLPAFSHSVQHFYFRPLLYDLVISIWRPQNCRIFNILFENKYSAIIFDSDG